MNAEERASHQVSSGLPDAAFETDGLLTKRPFRAFALAMLAPVGDELLWDLGAGSGSIGIEWCRLHPGNRAVAVEREEARRARIVPNAARHGVSERLQVVAGDVGAVLGRLETPDAVFVGGGLSQPVLASSWAALRPGGRIVAHSVTADSDGVLLEALRLHGGELTRISVENAEPLGRFISFKPLRTVTAWAATKG